MTPLGWLAAAAALAVAPSAGPAGRRVIDLAGAGRLWARPVDPDQGDGPALARRLPGVAGVALAGAGFWFGGVPLGVAATAVAGAAGLVLNGALARRATLARRADLLAALRVIVAELEAGARPDRALEAGAEIGRRYAELLRRAAGEAARGGDAAEVLAREPTAHAIGIAWGLGEGTGAALAGVLERVTADLAAADDQRRAVAVALAGPRASGVVLAGLPLVGLAMGTAMGARPIEFLTALPAGRVVGCVGVLLDVAGVLWIRRILSRAEQT